MDLRNGRMYLTREDALAAGVPTSDIAEVVSPDPQSFGLHEPEVRFASGPFKNRTYKRNQQGQLVRIDAGADAKRHRVDATK
mgnify:CR=1 FL=1